MKIRISVLPTAVAISALLFSSLSLATPPQRENHKPINVDPVGADAAESKQSVDTGLSAATYFTDELGNRRQPTNEERVAMGAGFQKELAKLAGKHKGNPNMQQHANGSVSSTVGLSKIQFLTVQENPDGSKSYGHGQLDENGNVTLPAATNLQEK